MQMQVRVLKKHFPKKRKSKNIFKKIDFFFTTLNASGFLIDGYPREVAQGEQFESSVSHFYYTEGAIRFLKDDF